MYSYNFQDQSVSTSNLKFGLNSKVFMKSFTYNPNGGKDGAAQEALDIIFDVNGTDISYRQFPITKAMWTEPGGQRQETTDPSHPEFVKAVNMFNNKISQILSAYADQQTIITAFTNAGQISSFQHFISVCASIIPPNYSQVPVDLFLEYQWNLAPGKDRTYLQVPKSTKHGLFICKHVEGDFEMRQLEKFDASTKEAIYFVNPAQSSKHPFTRSGWYASSAFAIQQRSQNAGQTISATNLPPVTPPPVSNTPQNSPAPSNFQVTSQPQTQTPPASVPPVPPASNQPSTSQPPTAW